MKCFLSSLCLICLTILPNSAIADVWVPPWGEAIYDSILINIDVGENETSVEVNTLIGVRKLVSDDYLLHFSRGSINGNLDEESAEAEVSDQLSDFETDDNLIRLTYLSTVAQEEELSLSVVSRYTFPYERAQDMLNEMIFHQAFTRTSEDSAWWGVNYQPVYESAGFQVTISSNVDLSACCWNAEERDWGRAVSGNNISIDGELFYTWNHDTECLAHLMKIEFDNDGETVDSLFEDVMYELVPETRERTPDLILDEDVRIALIASYPEDDDYDYYMIADISLNPDIALDLSPMWLWFPNDQTEDPEVLLNGLFAQGAWGRYPENYREIPLEIRQGRIGNQDGFYIKVPTLEVRYSNPNDVWFWSEPNLRVEVRQEIQGSSARFILITAPLEPSQIRFTIPDWMYFNTWENPLEEVQIERRMIGNVLTFSGNCPEPGIASVTWSSESAPSDGSTIPEHFDLIGIYPNPFNASTTITYGLPVVSRVSLQLYDLSGREIRTLVDSNKQAGVHRTILNASDLPSGLYFVKLKASDQVFTRKVMLIR